MTRSEVLTVLGGTAEDDLGDALLGLAVQYWREQGVDDDGILYLLEQVLEDEEGIEEE